MKVGGPQAISQLREKLQFDIGRHLYGVLGTYGQLRRFEQENLAQAQDHRNQQFPTPINVNRELLRRIGDGDLRQLVAKEGKLYHAIGNRLGQEFAALLKDYLQHSDLAILKHVEMLFAYNLDLSVLRTQASNQSHILLLLPAERRGEHIIIFHEAAPRFHRSIPPNLIADNHLWELSD